MLGEGLRAGLTYLGVSTRTVCFVEREAHAAGVLAARVEEGSLDAAPVWSDVCTFDAGAWRGRVDCVVAGFPCQDLSVAGRRAGLDGQRSGLFFEVVRIATDSGAWLLFLENVAGIASATASVVDPEEGELDERAAARVVGELADLGWDAEWITLAASDVGASHGRARWFCLAWRLGHAGLQHQQLQQRADGSEHPRADIQLDHADRAGAQRPGRAEQGPGAGREGMEHTPGIGRQERRAEPAGQQGRFDVAEHGGAVADASDERQPEPVGGGMPERMNNRTASPSLSQVVTHSPSLPQALPTPDGPPSSPSTPNSPRHLNPLFGAWLMGWPSTWVIAEPHASSAWATGLWRCRLQQRLSCLLDGQQG